MRNELQPQGGDLRCMGYRVTSCEPQRTGFYVTLSSCCIKGSRGKLLGLSASEERHTGSHQSSGQGVIKRPGLGSIQLRSSQHGPEATSEFSLLGMFGSHRAAAGPCSDIHTLRNM